MRVRLFVTLGVLIPVGLVAGGYFAIELLSLDANVITALATALAAAFAGASAAASLVAARQSTATARDASRAYAYATKPDLLLYLQPNDNGRLHVTVENISLHIVGHGILSWRLRDGTTGRHTFGSIDALTLPWQRGDALGPHLDVDLGNAPKVDGTDYITVDYWGPYVPTTGWRQDYEMHVATGSATVHAGRLSPSQETELH
ncbi:hypothetical protein ACPPVW_13060 [Leifsonia sp. McL0607]|uniref:hypothetical protein n=1 Tax=Leifsonia sp. McL0607 TaxID=3415672 RepID=UPI003CF23308